ncbi:glycosyl transferase, family 2 (plasmid) [Deinococcus geothermalis DSM 11300]|uniref:Glycosyl transferase, family 2 n=1 Tax=Deinococcus geothermalis (strain DSM 11300 / CIP 105573 / AG-3a) TaxID=319795 RepID=Q1J348_DEIGD|nr:glycosyltransferase family 2 protein [Deinococcus geothermalis]ABF44086.1 glycosyl transferase, family 2 [Deinococcus geothermalis DSM 11300]
MGQEQREKGVEAPLVSVVIPTHRRADLLLRRALPSALGQTLQELEVIVVVDGADPETLAGLATVRDARVRVVALRENVGGAEARNVGIRQARAEWVALLDDDDEWLPHKLERQWEAARRSPHRFPVLACGWIVRRPEYDTLSPVRLLEPGERIGDYLIARKTLLTPECGLTSTLLFARRELLLRMPFTPGLPKHQDWDWLLRVDRLEGVGFEILPETSAITYYGDGRPQMSNTIDWRWSLAWGKDHYRQGRLTNKAYVAFVVSQLAVQAAREGASEARWLLLREILAARPRAFELLRYVLIWGVPLRVRQVLRGAVQRFSLPVRRAAVKSQI